MVLFTVLFIIALILIVATLAVVSVGGAIGVILFGDVIVCIFLLVWAMKKLFKNR